MNITSLSVFFPAYNEEKNIESTVLNAVRVLKKYKLPWEIIVVNDGSKDKTEAVAQKLARRDKRIRVITQKNGGYGAALQTGFKNAKYDWVVYTDSDGQFNFSELGKFLDLSDQAEAIWGIRQKRSDPWYRNIFGLCWRVPLRLMFNVKLHDVDCGFKLIKRSTVNKAFPLNSYRGAMVNAELAIKIKNTGANIAEVRVSHKPRQYGKPSGYALPVILNSYKDLFKLWLKSGKSLSRGESKLPIVLILGTLSVTAVASFILPFIYWPEMLNWPFFVLHGWEYYRDISVVYPPLFLWLIEGTYRLLGTNLLALHILGTSLILSTTALIYAVVFRQSKNYQVALVAASLFVFLNFAFEGNTVWFESGLPVLLLPIYYLLTKLVHKFNLQQVIMVGILGSLAIGVKQTTAYLLPILPIFFYYLYRQKKWSLQNIVKAKLILLATFLAFTLLLVLWLVSKGLLADFYYWAIQFVFMKPFTSAGAYSWVKYPNLLQLVLLAPFVGTALFICWKQRTVPVILAGGFFLLSLLYAFPRFEYFHLLPSLAFLAILVGQAVSLGKKQFTILVVLLIAVGCVVWFRTQSRVHTFIEPEVMEIATTIKEKYSDQSMLVFNGPEQLYFLSGKMPSFSPWISQHPWYFNYYGNERFFNDAQTNFPQIVIHDPYLDKPVYGLGAYKSEPMWSYIENSYSIVEIFLTRTTVYQRP